MGQGHPSNVRKHHMDVVSRCALQKTITRDQHVKHQRLEPTAGQYLNVARAIKSFSCACFFIPEIDNLLSPRLTVL